MGVRAADAQSARDVPPGGVAGDEDGDETYLDAVAKETLRARPVVYDVARRLGAPATVKGWKLPAGAYVVPSITAVHLLQGIYERAEEFRPERFLEGDQPDSYAWIPFGGGRRRCIGAAFATMEMKAVLAEVLSRVEVAGAGPEAGAHQAAQRDSRARKGHACGRRRAHERPSRPGRAGSNVARLR